jgi:hypothetical protein
MSTTPAQQITRAGATLPVKLLILDVIGSLMLAVGLVLMIADPTEFLPWQADYDAIGMGLVIVGVLFMLPLIAHLVGMARAQASRGPGTAPPPAP